MQPEDEQIEHKPGPAWRTRLVWAGVIMLALFAALGWWLEHQEQANLDKSHDPDAPDVMASVPLWAIETERESIKQDFLTNAKLGRKVSGDYVDVALSEVLDDLMGQADVPYELTKYMMNIGISADLPVTLTIPEMPLREALDRVFDEASGELGGIGRLEWIVIDGVVMVASREQTDDPPWLDRNDVFDAYRILRNTRIVGSWYTGWMGRGVSRQWQTFETIARSEKATLVFLDLLRHGTPEAKAYALLGLKHVAPKRFAIEVKKYDLDQEVYVWTDDLQYDAPIKDVLEWADPRETWRQRQDEAENAADE